MEANIQEITDLWQKYLNSYLTPEEKRLADTFAQVRSRFVQEGLRPTIEALRAGQVEQAKRLYESRMAELYPPVRDAVDALVKLQIDVAQQEYTTAETRYERLLMLMSALILAGVGLALWAGFAAMRAITRPLGHAIAVFDRIAQGKYDNAIEIAREDEVGQVLKALQAMQAKLDADVSETRRLANENLRIRNALDNVTTNVMIADKDYNIIYMNQSQKDMLAAAEADLKKVLPNFNVNKLIGESMDLFHRNPSHQRQLLERLTGPYRTQITVGGRTFCLIASPVVNDRGERLGTVVEWADRTAEVAVENEVASIVKAAGQGDFSQRMSLEGKDGFFRQLGEGINQFLEVCANGMNDVARMLGALAQGDLTQRITADYSGTFGKLKDDANATAEQLKEIVGRIKEATDTINTAAKEIAAGNTDLSQRTEEQASSLEETASSMEELTSTVKQNAENAKQANQLAKGASDIATRGGQVVAEVVETMNAINDSSKKIVDIISVIDGIAFQTNILALNAAVEAARAGEQGRGFAVVAGEVRNLAQRSAAAAKEIKTLISDSVAKVEDGSKLVANAGATMEEIVTAVKRVTDIMAEISAASVEQSAGIEQVNAAVAQMDEVTQQNAALVEQAAAAAESLEEQAHAMAELVSVFKLDQAGVPRRVAPPVPAAAQAPERASRKVAGRPAAAAKAGAGGQADEWEEF